MTSTTQSKRADVMRKVQGLLAKANDPAATPAEAEAFMNKADELMVRWAIEEAELSTTSEGDAGKVISVKLLIPAPSVYRTTWRDGLYAIVRAVECDAVYGCNQKLDINEDGTYNRTRKGNPRYVKEPYLKVYGTASDVEYLQMLWVGLLAHIRHDMDTPEIHGRMVAECGTGIQASGAKLAWRNTFINACLGRVASRIRSQRTTVAQESAGNSLVLADRKDRARAALVEDNPNLGQASASSASHSSAGAYTEGRASGDRASLNNTKIGGTKGALR